jgi:hypothetical protein
VLNEEWYSKEWENAHKKNYETNEGRNFLRLASTSLSKKKGHLYLNHSSKIYKKSNDNLLLSRKLKQAIRIYTMQEITKMFEEAGIKTKYVFGGTALKPGKDEKTLLIAGYRNRRS